MGESDPKRARRVKAFEVEAETLTTLQLDLLAHLEYQLRSVRQTMRQIEKLRGARHRVGPELSNGERGDALRHLHAELDALQAQIKTQSVMCLDMHKTVTEMET